MLLGDTVGVLGLIGLQVFILLLLMQSSAGTKAFKRAFKATAAFVALELAVISSKQFGGAQRGDLKWFCLWELAEEALMLWLFVAVLLYASLYQTVCRRRKRSRNNILWAHSVPIALLQTIVVAAYILLIFG